MAKVKKNVVIEGLSGRIGNLVFRQYGDQTVVSSMPVHDPKREPTPGEAAQQARIKEAASLAKFILASEEGNDYYQEARQRLGKRSAYHTAIFDFFGEPEVLNMRVDAERTLHIEVQDNVGVQEVSVQVDGQKGAAAPLEKAPCVRWHYILDGDGPWSIQVHAKDRMGKVGKWQGIVKMLFENSE